MKKLSLLLIGLSLVLSCFSQGNRKINWDADLDSLAKILPHRHFNLFFEKSKDEYLIGIKKIRNNKKELSNLEVALSIQQLLASMGDSHTRVLWQKLVNKEQILPLELYWMKDGIYILKTTEKHKDLLGYRIQSINGVPIGPIIDSVSTLITVENQALVKSKIPNLLTLVEVLKYFGITEKSKLKLGLKDYNGRAKDSWIEPEEMNKSNSVTYKADSIALCQRNSKIFFIDYYQEQDGIYYVQYNKCSSRERERMRGRKDAEEKPSINKFSAKVLNVLDTKPIEKLVFDVRFNTGGSSNQGTKLIEKIAAIQKQKPEMKLYVVLGRYTFSSAIINAMDFKRLTDAIYLGEETSGKPNHFGELWDLKLPSSGLTVLYSTKYFKETEEEMNSLIPDVQLEATFEDFKVGVDPVYEWIKRQ